MRIFLILGSSFKKFSDLQSLERYSLKYAQVTIGNSSEHRVLRTWNFFIGIQKSEKSFFEFMKCFYLWLIQSASMLKPW